MEVENTGRPCLCSSQTVQLNTERTGTALEIEKGWGGGVVVAFLESIREPSSGHTVNAARAVQAMAA